MRGGATVVLSLVSLGGFPGWEVAPMDIENALTIMLSFLSLMISFGMLVAFIMSNRNDKK